MENKETLITIAQRTGYSVSTVSRVLSGKAAQQRISSKTIEAITREAKRCNYIPNLIAKGLRTKNSGIIGLVVPSLDNPFFANISNEISTIMSKENIQLMIGCSQDSPERELSVIKSFIDNRVQGIIAIPSTSSSDAYEATGKNVPLIMIDRYFPDTKLDYVSCDNYTGGYMAAEYLIRRGYRNISMIQGDEDSMPNKERVRGFRDAVRNFDHLNVKCRTTGNRFSSENGYLSILKILAGEKPDVVFCLGVTIALGAIQAIHEAGLKIPDDIGIFTYDDNVFLDYLNPPLTRIAQPLKRMCELGCSILLQKMNGRSEKSDNEATQILIKPTLKKGGSC